MEHDRDNHELRFTEDEQHLLGSAAVVGEVLILEIYMDAYNKHADNVARIAELILSWNPENSEIATQLLDENIRLSGLLEELDGAGKIIEPGLF